MVMKLTVITLLVSKETRKTTAHIKLCTSQALSKHCKTLLKLCLNAAKALFGIAKHQPAHY